jgi:hypothetical protein
MKMKKAIEITIFTAASQLLMDAAFSRPVGLDVAAALCAGGTAEAAVATCELQGRAFYEPSTRLGCQVEFGQAQRRES